MKKILKWLDNYWYHYKWQTIIGVSFAVIIVVLVMQFASKTDYDISVIYAGPEAPTANQTREMENALASLVSEDMNGDGKKNATILNFFLLTEKQKEQKVKEADERGEMVGFNAAEIQDTRNSFTTHVFTGESMICLLDPEWYDLIREQDGFLELSEIFDSVPEYAVDGFAVRLCDTPFAKFYNIFSILPDDTLLCFRRPSTASLLGDRDKENEKYAKNKEIFKSIVEFE